MKTSSRRISASITIALGIVLFVAVNIVSNSWLGSTRLDLTQNGLYTLSPGTRGTLMKLQEPVTIRLYYARQQAAAYAQVVAYAQRVRDMLKQYASLSGGKLRFEGRTRRQFAVLCFLPAASGYLRRADVGCGGYRPHPCRCNDVACGASCESGPKGPIRDRPVRDARWSCHRLCGSVVRGLGATRSRPAGSGRQVEFDARAAADCLGCGF